MASTMAPHLDQPFTGFYALDPSIASQVDVEYERLVNWTTALRPEKMRLWILYLVYHRNGGAQPVSRDVVTNVHRIVLGQIASYTIQEIRDEFHDMDQKFKRTTQFAQWEQDIIFPVRPHMAAIEPFVIDKWLRGTPFSSCQVAVQHRVNAHRGKPKKVRVRKKKTSSGQAPQTALASSAAQLTGGMMAGPSQADLSGVFQAASTFAPTVAPTSTPTSTSAWASASGLQAYQPAYQGPAYTQPATALAAVTSPFFNTFASRPQAPGPGLQPMQGIQYGPTTYSGPHDSSHSADPVPAARGLFNFQDLPSGKTGTMYEVGNRAPSAISASYGTVPMNTAPQASSSANGVPGGNVEYSQGRWIAGSSVMVEGASASAPERFDGAQSDQAQYSERDVRIDGTAGVAVNFDSLNSGRAPRSPTALLSSLASTNQAKSSDESTKMKLKNSGKPPTKPTKTKAKKPATTAKKSDTTRITKPSTSRRSKATPKSSAMADPSKYEKYTPEWQEAMRRTSFTHTRPAVFDVKEPLLPYPLTAQLNVIRTNLLKDPAQLQDGAALFACLSPLSELEGEDRAYTPEEQRKIVECRPKLTKKERSKLTEEELEVFDEQVRVFDARVAEESLKWVEAGTEDGVKVAGLARDTMARFEMFCNQTTVFRDYTPKKVGLFVAWYIGEWMEEAEERETDFVEDLAGVLTQYVDEYMPSALKHWKVPAGLSKE